MKKEEILEKGQKDKEIVGEAEKKGINKSCWIALISAGSLAVAMIIVEGILGHIQSIFAIAAICYIWAGVFYFCQYFIAKRPYGVLIGAVLESAAAITMIVLYAVSYVQGW